MCDVFICEECGCVDDIHATQLTSGYLCSQCATGAWHGEFERFSIDPATTTTLNGETSEQFTAFHSIFD